MRKVGVLCEQIIEAGWLLALVIVPLFFDVYSSRVFEPDKISLLRTIATVMAAAWIAQRIERATQPGAAPGQPGALERFIRAPLVAPTLLVAVVYILATITSVAPRASLWGSYQRLQGTYTTLSYMVVFLLMLQTLRRREQLDRLLTTIVLTSFPIALYGLLQHYQLDPLPWGGDVTFRVAANMGNAIFIGAYLIMVVPITLAQTLREGGKAWAEIPQRLRLPLGLFFAAAWVLQLVAWAGLGFERGLITSILLIVMLALAAAWLRKSAARFILLGAYGVTLAAQLVCIFFSQSRGPWLGLGLGLLLFGLLYVFERRWRVVAVAFVGAVVALAALLAVLNMPNSPLASVRDVPYVGRLGRMMEIEDGTGKVRVLIWEGAAKMITANPARALIGYGPEAMYVAYNPYYPPELAHYEARNASPDRSHNEAFDALVTTGLVGYLVYMFFFTSIFYYSLTWLGLIRGPNQKRLFAALVTAGTLIGLAIPLLADRSLRFMGVGLPLGLLAGVLLYMGIAVLRNLWAKEQPARVAAALGATPGRLWADEVGGQAAEGRSPAGEGAPRVDVLLIALLAAIIAHFVEIHFGIAVVATRTYFWVYAALLALVGQGLIASPQVAVEPPPAVAAHERPRRVAPRSGARRPDPRAATRPGPVGAPAIAAAAPWAYLIALAIVAGFILATLAWNYTTNPLGGSTPIGIIISSLTTMNAKSTPGVISLGMLWLVLATFGLLTLVGVAEAAALATESHRASHERDSVWWLKALGAFAATAAGAGLLYTLIHASRLNNPRINVPTLIVEYYALVVVLWAALALQLYRRTPKPSGAPQAAALASLVILLLAAILFSSGANLRIIRADISYKQGLKYDGAGQWDNAIFFYQQAIDTAPQEDFYYLFLGRALMEKAKLAADVAARDGFFAQALEALQTAQQLNPLNTDHTANIGRLHRTWGEMESDSARRGERYNLALTSYQQAIKLSPNNAQLYNEHGLVFYLMGQYDLAMAKYDESLALDTEFLQTYLLISDVHFARQEWAKIIELNDKIVAKEPRYVQGWSAIGYAYSQLGDWDKGIAANLKVLEISPEDYGTLKNVALLYQQQGDLTQALTYAERALAVVPEAEKAMVEQFIAQVKAELNP